MPSLTSVLKDAIVRLARKELRKEVEGLKKVSAQYRSSIAALKRQVAALEKQQSQIQKKSPNKAAPEASDEGNSRFRFSAKRFAAQRQKLGLSAGDMGTLIGVSAQTVYNWEAEKSRPRQQQLAAIAVVRSMGKRQIKAQLETATRTS